VKHLIYSSNKVIKEKMESLKLEKILLKIYSCLKKEMKMLLVRDKTLYIGSRAVMFKIPVSLENTGIVPQSMSSDEIKEAIKMICFGNYIEKEKYRDTNNGYSWHCELYFSEKQGTCEHIILDAKLLKLICDVASLLGKQKIKKIKIQPSAEYLNQFVLGDTENTEAEVVLMGMRESK
jgi:hypothetical protein